MNRVRFVNMKQVVRYVNDGRSHRLVEWDVEIDRKVDSRFHLTKRGPGKFRLKLLDAHMTVRDRKQASELIAGLVPPCN